MNQIPLSFLFLALLLPTGCGDSAEASRARQEIDEALDAAGNYTQKEIEDLTTSLEKRWTDLKTDLTKLKAEAAAKGESVKADLDEAIADLEARASDAKTNLDAVADSAEVGKTLDNLEKAFESAKASVQEMWREVRK